jgi:hypothetical protein
MPEPQARALSVLKSILLSQWQSIYHDNALYISIYYFYFIEGADEVSTENDNNFGYEKITILEDNIPLKLRISLVLTCTLLG